MSVKVLTSLTEKSGAKIPLKLVLLVPFVIEVCIVVGITGWLTWQHGQKSVDQVASQWRGEISDRIEQQLEDYLKTPHLINQINLDGIRSGAFRLNVRQWRWHFWQQLKTFPTVTGVQLALDQKDLISLQNANLQNANLQNANLQNTNLQKTQNNSKQSISLAIADQQTKSNLHIYDLDQRGFPGKLIKSLPNNDPRQLAWYKTAITKPGASWSQVHSQVNHQDYRQQPNITAVLPIYGGKRQVLGVLGVNLSLPAISEFLQEIIGEKQAEILIIERSGLIIATSQPADQLLTNTTNDNSGRQQLKITDSNHPLTKTTAEYLQGKFGDFSQINTPQEFQLTVEKRQQFLRVTPFQDGRGIDWLIIVALPDSQLHQVINTQTRNIFLYCLLAFFLATLLGSLAGHWLSNHIARLSNASRAIANGNLSQRVPQSFIEEISDLAIGLEKMAKQLRRAINGLTRRQLELKENKEKLAQVQIHLLQSEKMSSLGNLVAGVAHEINNPVGFLSGNLDMAEEYLQFLLQHLQLYQEVYQDISPATSEKITAHAEEIELDYLIQDLPEILSSMRVGVEQIKQISQSLRNFSRSDHKNKVMFNLHEGLDSTLLILKHRLKANEKRPAIEIVKDYDEIPRLECFAGQLNQVFINLLANAIDAFDEANQGKSFEEIKVRPNQITIKTFVKEEAIPLDENDSEFIMEEAEELEQMAKPQMIMSRHGTLELLQKPKVNTVSMGFRPGYVVIMIKDNGPGIPAEIIERLFEHLFTTKAVGQGTGLGLSISKQIIEEYHGGKLYCQSQVGMGAEFIIEIPIMLN